MVRTQNECTIESKVIRGGNGETIMTKLLSGAEEMNGKGRMFNLMTLKPGRTIGEHTHEGDSEVFYFLSGEGVYNDNGTLVTVKPGDVALCKSGELHSLANNGTEDLVFVALILYA